MSNNRIPTIEEVSNLTRDQWERLCQSICSIQFDAKRVEDRKGKGNGLDAWRFVECEAIEGFQFRRFDLRFGYSQAEKIKDNISLAYKKCLNDIGLKLKKFTLLINIDFQPSHCGKKEELAYFKDIKEWANREYDIEVNYFDLSWVHSQLLSKSFLMPDLFEDLYSEIKYNSDLVSDKTEKIESKVDAITDVLKNIQKDVKMNSKIGNIIYKLTSEALTHYERGKKYKDSAQISSAIISMEDAKRLLEIDDVDEILLGKVLCSLCGLKTLAGYLNEALKDGRRAIKLVKSLNDQTLILHALGNVGYNLYQTREEKKCNEAKNIFSYLIEEYEKDGNADDMLLTLIHITETCIYLQDLENVIYWSERLRKTANLLINKNGGSNLCLNAMGTLGNALLELGIQVEDNTQIEDAYRIFDDLELLARGNNEKFIALNALGQKACCLWNLDELEEAERLYGVHYEESKAEFKQIAADSLYNRAKINLEKGDDSSAIMYLEEAKKKYIDIGELSSAQEIEDELNRLMYSS